MFVCVFMYIFLYKIFSSYVCNTKQYSLKLHLLLSWHVQKGEFSLN